MSNKNKSDLIISKINATIEGLSDIMFDRFVDYSKEKRPTEQKLYIDPDGKTVVLPADNLLYFMFSSGVPGCAKFFEGKGNKNYIMTGLGHLFINPTFIPFTQNGKPIEFIGFGKQFVEFGASALGGTGSARVKQEMKYRPILKMPWELSFEISLVKNDLIDENKLYNWFTRGGIMIGIGTYRPRFGRFMVKKWDIK